MASRCILQLSKIPRSCNNNYNHCHNIKRSITSLSPPSQTIVDTNSIVNGLIRKNNNGTVHNDNQHHRQGRYYYRYYSSTTYKNFSSQQQQQEQSFFESMKSKLSLSGYPATKKESEEAKQFKRLANMETFSMKDFQEELESTRTWKEKMFGSIVDKENKERVDKILKLVKTIKSQLKDGQQSILNLGRKDKIIICMKTNDDKITIDDVNEVIQLYNNMEFMHRLLRYRKSNGKSIPDSEEGMRIAAEEDQKKIVTGREKKLMKQKFMRGMNRRTSSK